jgi:dihydroorotate dehydrogenase electron transfer subunit
MQHFISRIRSNSILGEGMHEMVFSWDHHTASPLPGQFCTIRVSPCTVPLLRRPFAFSSFDPIEKTAAIVYKKVGAATEILAGKKSGDELDVIGPLGNSFTVFQQTAQNILVAGGTGFGPVFFLKRFLKQRHFSTVMVLGSASKAGIPDLKGEEDQTVVLCTEDGSRGFHGTVVDYLRCLPQNRFQEASIFCCGPWGMLSACNDLAVQYGVECFVSIEQIMACGVGACMGCAVKIKGDPPFARVCREGPIFNSRMIAWT